MVRESGPDTAGAAPTLSPDAVFAVALTLPVWRIVNAAGSAACWLVGHARATSSARAPSAHAPTETGGPSRVHLQPLPVAEHMAREFDKHRATRALPEASAVPLASSPRPEDSMQLLNLVCRPLRDSGGQALERNKRSRIGVGAVCLVPPSHETYG